METTDKFGQIRKGLLEFLVLKIISSQKVYVADLLKKLNETQFKTQEGTLYPLLSKLRREGFVNYEWIESESGPPRKYYSLTDSGTLRLQDFDIYWREMDTTIKKLRA